MLHVLVLLVQDFLYFEDFVSLSNACYINVPDLDGLIDTYTLNDRSDKLEFIFDRLEDTDSTRRCCYYAVMNKSYSCISMLMKKGNNIRMKICNDVYYYDAIDVFNYLKDNGLIQCFSSMSFYINNSVLEALIDLFASGVLYKPSLYYELEQLGLNELLYKIQHVYYQ